MRAKTLAATEFTVLAASSADLARRARGTTGFALLLPYVGWTAFATILSSSIAWLNRGRRTRS
jgi:benzodiazapine receptor